MHSACGCVACVPRRCCAIVAHCGTFGAVGAFYARCHVPAERFTLRCLPRCYACALCAILPVILNRLLRWFTPPCALLPRTAHSRLPRLVTRSLRCVYATVVRTAPRTLPYRLRCGRLVARIAATHPLRGTAFTRYERARLRCVARLLTRTTGESLPLRLPRGLSFTDLDRVAFCVITSVCTLLPRPLPRVLRCCTFYVAPRVAVGTHLRLCFALPHAVVECLHSQFSFAAPRVSI